MLITSLLIVVACFLFSYALLSSSLSTKTKPRLHLPPGPYNLPLIGSLHRIGYLPHRSLNKLCQTHGPLVYLNLGTVPTVVVSSAKTAREFLKVHDLECCSRPLLAALDKLSYGFKDMAFTPYGEQWRELRKFGIVQLLSSKKVASFRHVREEEVERMISSVSSQTYVNLTEELLAFASNVTCRTALGKKYHSDGGKLHQIMKETQAMLNGFFFADYMPMLAFLDVFTGMRARLEKNFRELDGFYQKVIDEHKDPMRRRDEKDGGDAIDAMLDMQNDGTTLTEEHIKGILMVLMFFYS